MASLMSLYQQGHALQQERKTTPAPAPAGQSASNSVWNLKENWAGWQQLQLSKWSNISILSPAGFLGRWLEMRQVRRSSICPESGMQELYLTDFCIAVIGIGIKRTRQSEIAGTHCSRFWKKMNCFTTILKRKEMLNWTCVEATSCTQSLLVSNFTLS